MVAVVKKLNESYHTKNLTLTLTDLYPDTKLVNTTIAPGVHYSDKPIDATNVPSSLTGIRTMICSFHHMKPDAARKILIDAKESRQPICIYEISDNSSPTALWWVALPINFILTFLITPFVRPLTWQQIVFTYLIPIIPIFFAWDGAVSNARTYTLNDLDILLEGLTSNDYQWKKGVLPGKAKKIFLLGIPQ